MKVAICLSGLSRCVLSTFDSVISKIAKTLNADIFIHTWDIDDDKNRFGDSVDYARSLKSGKAEFFTQYSYVKGVLIEQFNSSWNFLNVRSVANIVPMYYSIFKANELKCDYERHTGISYDVVIRSRFDSFYENEMNKSELNNAIDSNIVYIGLNAINKGHYASRKNFKSESTNCSFVADNFAFGSSAVMNIYSNTYCSLNNILRCTATPETCLGIQLQQNNITPVWTNYRYKSLIEWAPDKLTFWSDYEQPETLYIT
jgi:hypothetical protein